MAERNLTVRLTIQGADQMAAAHKKVAAAAQEQAKATRALSDVDRERIASQQRMRDALADADRHMRHGTLDTRERLSLRERAMMQINADQERDMLQAELRKLDPKRYGRGAGIASMLPRGVGSIIGAAAIASGIGAAGESLAAQAQDERGPRALAGSVSTMLKEMTQGIPIIGNLTTGIERFVDAVSGATAELAGAQRMLATAQRMLATQAQINLVERGARSEMFGAGQVAMDSQIAADAARGLAGAVAANRGLRGPDLAILQAQFAAEEAKKLAEQRRRETGGALPSGMSATDLDAMIANKRKELGRAQDVEREREAELSAARDSFFSRESPREAALATAQADAARKAGELAELMRAKEADLLAIKERQRAANQANLNLGQKQFELAKAQLDAEQARLDKSKSLAQAIGSAQPGEAEEALRILQAIKQGGVGAVSPEEAQFAARFAPQFIQTQQINAGQQNPIFQQLNAFAQDTTAIAGQLGDIEQRLIADNAKILADWKERQARANKEFVGELADTLVQLVDALKAAIANNGEIARLQQALQGAR